MLLFLATGTARLVDVAAGGGGSGFDCPISLPLPPPLPLPLPPPPTGILELMARLFSILISYLAPERKYDERWKEERVRGTPDL